MEGIKREDKNTVKVQIALPAEVHLKHKVTAAIKKQALRDYLKELVIAAAK